MNFERARSNMVEQQVRTWEVLDSKVLGLMENVHREDFVPLRYRKLAFADLSVPLAMGQSMMCPRVEGRMLQALDLQQEDSILEIGTGSGFITACLSLMARHVVSVELFEELYLEAEIRLRDKHMHNVELYVGDAMTGWQPQQAHDVVVVTGSVPAVPKSFRDWVNPGGRMFVVVGESPAMEARLLTRVGFSDWLEESLFETDLPRLMNSTPPANFDF
ncbi:MAG: protein-L-isoaspartate O-methyltransferase [Xanthomonadales bacterium]|nr:protein-L-isoaspartate O-methyltransferase [Xanthomonadales bacterium]